MSQIQYTEKEYSEGSRLKRESIFHVASGKLGVRGCFEEGAPEGKPTIRGTYLNGFAELLPITYNERLFGFPESKQQIVNLPDAQTVTVRAGNTVLSCFNGSGLVQTQDMENGVYTRRFVCGEEGQKLELCFTRLVSFCCPEVFALECSVKSLGYEGEITVESTLNPDVRNFTDSSDPRVASGDGKLLETVFAGISGNVLSVACRTKRSKRTVLCASLHDMKTQTLSGPTETGLMKAETTVSLSAGDEYVFRKYTLYREAASADALPEAVMDIGKVAAKGFEALRNEQKEYLSAFWRNARVKVEGNEALQAQLDFSLYGMLCSAGRDGSTNVAAKGLSGEGYEGHYFWDSEIYIFPFFLTAAPEIARALLRYRFLHLEEARAHARELGHPCGALYPWRTITGSECSSHYPSGSAQYHINGDIAHAFACYWDATEDDSFLEESCEVLVETARLWLNTGHWYEGKFRIDCVTGPDEYTCLVNNNYYTNACAAENMRNAARLCGELEKRGRLKALKAKLHLDEAELKAFEKAGENMFFPYDEKLGIIAQDDSFLAKKRIELSDIPKENFPLLMHYHPILINRCQVLKQADSVLANHIYREEDVLTMKRSYAYYEQITTHDSSLSNCIYAIMAARLGDAEHADMYFERCVGTDTEDLNGNTRDGLHVANMGGIYRVMTAGFGGLKINKEGVFLFPLLPASMKAICFPFYYKGSRVFVRAEKNECTLSLFEGAPVSVCVYGQQVTVGDIPVTVERRVHGVVFDLDGVITDTAKYHYLAWKKLADELGISFDEKKNEQFKGVSRARCLELLLSWAGKTVDREEEEALLVKKNGYYCDMLASLTPESILPGIRETLGLLRNAGIPVALFSVSKNTDRILQQLGMTEAFDGIVTGNDIEHSKPHYEGYLLAAERIHTDPRLCVMVEDSVAGIEGAKAVSMLTLAVMSENAAGADKCVLSTARIPEVLGGLLR